YPGIATGDYVSLAISDTGCGMSREVLLRTFEPFFTTKPEGQGTGLGLSMAYGFVKESGGHIHIDSAPGRGTTIRMLLPRSPDIKLLASAPASASTMQEERKTVLIVEDKS